MGYMRHNAIVVSAEYGDHLKRAHAEAKRLWMTVSPIVKSPTNGVCTFLVAPDGSKEGWSESDTGDAARAAFKVWLDQQRYEDGSGPLKWVEIQYGDDERETLVTAHSDEDARIEAGVLT